MPRRNRFASCSWNRGSQTSFLQMVGLVAKTDPYFFLAFISYEWSSGFCSVVIDTLPDTMTWFFSPTFSSWHITTWPRQMILFLEGFDTWAYAEPTIEERRRSWADPLGGSTAMISRGTMRGCPAVFRYDPTLQQGLRLDWCVLDLRVPASN